MGPATSNEPNLHISPLPSDEEAAAIVAAVTVAWPRPAVNDAPPVESGRWRFSGRWWVRPGWHR